MNETFLPWVMFLAYLGVIGGLAWWNRKRAQNMASFSIGSRQVSPVLVGLSLAANMTSVATFVINPGLIYAYGWAGVVGYGIAAPLGIFTGLVVTSRRFRQVGDQVIALTVPQWIGDRYGDRRLTAFFALISLLQITFLVLIVAALVHVLMSVLHLPLLVALTIVILFTFAVIFVGGASVHVWSNSVQAVTMIVVAVLLVAAGAGFFAGGLGAFFDRLAAVAPHYGSMTNPDSLLFRDLFEVVVANFIIGVAIFAQNGVYGLFAAVFAPVLFGIFSRRATGGLALAAALTALVVHFGMYYGGITRYHNNPAVPAACALVLSTAVMAAGVLLRGKPAGPDSAPTEAT
jgi:sodium/pantothenate symporter